MKLDEAEEIYADSKDSSDLKTQEILEKKCYCKNLCGVKGDQVYCTRDHTLLCILQNYTINYDHCTV